MNALLHSPPAPAAVSAAHGRHRVVPAKAAGPPAAVAAAPRKPLRAPRLAAVAAVVIAHAAPLALGLPLAAVPLVVGGLGLAAILLSRWSR
jgi:hypothetical protein